MPVLPSSYIPPPLLSTGHLLTVYPSLFRRVGGVVYRRERIDTPDGDFLDLDWSEKGNRRLVIVSHGLEGDTRRHYVLGMIRAMNRRGFDGLAWNYRGCSGEPNRLLRSYHSGATEDLDTVISHAAALGIYDEIVLVGFSLGGNLTLKYLGERGDEIESRISRAVAFSVPCDLRGSAYRLAERGNMIYMRRFIGSLRAKMIAKHAAHPESIGIEGIDRIRTFLEFDDIYTAPIHGFGTAEEYWRRNSSRQFLPRITIPTLLVNALDDPFLPESCYPYAEATASATFHLETPRHGGHVGFVAFNREGEYWAERRVGEWVSG
jgi:predicted alpha/beta-fold hydrolase